MEQDKTKVGTILPEEEILKKIEEVLEWMKEQPCEIHGSKDKPYYCFCNNEIYKKFKEGLPLDENDMYFTINGWVKVINVNKPFEVEVKPYEVKKEDNPFCNTFKKPFYRDVFKKNKKDYAIKVLGKWSKRK